VAGRTTGHLITFLALFWMTGGLITPAVRPGHPATSWVRLGLAAAIAAVVGAVLVLLATGSPGSWTRMCSSGCWAISAVLTGLLRILGGFAAEERVGRRWTLGGIALGTLELALGALLLAQGLRLRRFARTWQASQAALHGRGSTGAG
jgi:hypothetical protein